MDVLGQDGSDGLYEQDLHDDVFATVDVAERSPRVADLEQVRKWKSPHCYCVVLQLCTHTHSHIHSHKYTHTHTHTHTLT